MRLQTPQHAARGRTMIARGWARTNQYRVLPLSPLARGGHPGPCCTDHGWGRNDPYPVLGSCDADVGRASQLQHAVQDLDRHVHLRRPTLVCVRAQPIPDHALVASDGGLGAGPVRVPGRHLPPPAAPLSDELKVRSRWVGAVSAVALGTAVERGGTMTAAAGWLSATLA